MNFFRATFTFFFLLTILASCTSNKQEETTDTDQTELSSDNPEITDDEREPTDDEIREFGKITSIEDGAYPFFSITVEFPERKMIESFGFNVENNPLSVEELMAMEGKFATLYYTSELENSLIDIHLNGQSLFGEAAPELWPELKTFIGVLTDAVLVSGDLPDEILVIDSDRNELEFELFVTEEVVAANNKEVTVYYDVSGVSTITYLSVSEED